ASGSGWSLSNLPASLGTQPKPTTLRPRQTRAANGETRAGISAPPFIRALTLLYDFVIGPRTRSQHTSKLLCERVKGRASFRAPSRRFSACFGGVALLGEVKGPRSQRCVPLHRVAGVQKLSNSLPPPDNLVKGRCTIWLRAFPGRA